jgi:flagellar motor protein MotB
MSALGAILGLAGSVGSSLISNAGAKRRQQLADKQNVSFWKMQNAYNTPKEQMKRLQDAGLNPNLIYGSNANTGVAGSIAPSKPAPYNIQNPTPSMMQTALLSSQIDLQKSQAEKNRADANQTNELLGGKKTNLELRNEIQAIKNEIAGKTKVQQINIIKQSSLQADFNTKIKEVDQQFALEGFVKGNPIGTIFAQLGINGGGEENQLLRRALIAGLLGSQVINNLSGPLTKIIKGLKR